MQVFKGEIREYTRVNDRIVRVHTTLTRSGEADEDFFIDRLTHEIIASEEIKE